MAASGFTRATVALDVPSGILTPEIWYYWVGFYYIKDDYTSIYSYI